MARPPAGSLRVPKNLQAQERIRQDILSGKLAPGQRLPQVSLARDLGISPTPVREALRHLQEEGLVCFLPFAGVVVAPISAEEVLELVHLRILLECEALARSFPFYTPANLEEAWRSLKFAADSGNPVDRNERVGAFLETLYRPAARPILLAEIMGLFRRGIRMIRTHEDILARLPADLPTFAHILQHLEQGSLSGAQEALRLLYKYSGIQAAAILYEEAFSVPVPPPRRRRSQE